MKTCARNQLLASIVSGAAFIVVGASTAANAQEPVCKDERIEAAGAASVFGEKRALSLAIANWQRAVRRKYGEEYIEWAKAVEKTQDCGSASVGTLGKFNKRCTVTAIPCTLARLDRDRDYDRERELRERDRDFDRGREFDYRRDRDYVEDEIDPREIQRLLNRWGYRVRVDGVWGEESREALMRFQRRNGLEPDGEPGPRTRAALRGR